MQILSDEERIVLAVEALEREVNNGGYCRSLGNASRELAPSIADALLRIGCPVTARITRNAIRAVGVGAFAPDQIEAAMASEDEERDAPEDLAGQHFAYIRAKRDAIRLQAPQGTRTIFPNCSLFSRRTCAARISLAG